ncbi:MAG TPA: radical SAM protein [Bacteroidales bacterium]|nr:radical SAM protein [Bacteroidales bacterium]HQB21417.1 radical SAM protein [Bacteroidales bacterium]
MLNKILIYFPNTEEYNFTPPYESLFQIKALENFADNIIFIDARKNKDENYLKRILNDTSLIIITTLIKYTSITINFQLKDGIKLSNLAEKYTIPVIWTGMAALLLEKNIKEFCKNDLLLKTNYEGSLNNIISKLIKSENNAELQNLIDKENKNFYLPNSSFEEFGNFDFKQINTKDYIHNSTFDYIASTGCINSCSFCSVPVIYKQKWSYNKIENIIKHLKQIVLENEEIKTIHFRDDNFLVKKSFVFELFNKLHEENIVFLWSCQTSVNILHTYTNDEIQLLYKSGCRNISFGVESGDEFILKKVTKSKTNKTKTIEIFKKLIKNNISASITSIISFPYNKGRDFNKTLRFLMKLKLLYPQLSMYCTVFQPIPGTEIFNDIYKNKNYSLAPLANNTWTSKRKKSILKKYESFYFVFDNPDFYKQLSIELSKKIKPINKFFSPLIKLRFRIGYINCLWEFALSKKKMSKIKSKFGINTETSLSEIGIRHLTSNFNYGYSNKLKNKK